MLKKIKRRLMRRNNGGFTLVEVIVASALLGILLVGMMMFISPVMSLMQTEQQDARASIIGESIEHYISRSIRSTIFLKIFTNAKIEDTETGGLIYNDADLDAMIKWCADPANQNRYEVRCISIRKTDDERNRTNADLPTSRYMIYQEYFEPGTKTLSSGYSIPVFDSCFYGGLYPRISVTQATNKYEENKYSDTQIADPATEEDRPAVQIKVELFNDDKFGDNTKVFEGFGLTELFMIANKDKMSDGDVKNACIYKTDPPIRTDETVIAADNAYDTFIFYVARKSKVTTTPPVTPP